ncbi:MAG: M23 family metallopeptidase [FCB group bacterium]|nr:M23 family metallopeptidase [FCB group bacterium]
MFPVFEQFYAHLSHIRKDITPGVKVAAGDFLGRTGNTGTEPSTYGTRNQAHLHWEMIFQNRSGEFYLGQGMKNPDLVRFLAKLFSDSGVTE